MARRQSVFTGMLKFGIITIPCKLYKPHFDEEVLPSSHLEHNCGPDQMPSGQPVQRPWHCPACDHNVKFAQLVKVFDNGAVLTRSEVSSAKIPEKSFEIQEFVHAEDVDAMNLEGDVYFIECDGDASREAYSVLVASLKQTDRVGIAYYAARGTDKMVVVRPYRKGLVAQVLKCANLNDAPDFGTMLNAEVAEMTTFLSMMIEKKTVEFEPSKYKSQHLENMRSMVEKTCQEPVKQVQCKTSLAEMLKMMVEAA